MVTKQEIADKINKKGSYWIVFTGDSITSCEWVHPNWREIVEYALKDKLNDWGLKTFNFAYDGATSRDLANRSSELNLLKPDLVILLTGANDPFQNIEPEEFRGNVLKIKNAVEESGSRFILSSDNYPNNEWAASKCIPYIDELKSVTSDFINLFELSKTFPKDKIYTFIQEMDIPEERAEKNKTDFWHPNQLGNAYIAKVILKEVFGIEFDPELYIQTTLTGEKYPKY